MILRLLLPALSVIVLAPDLLHAQPAPGGGAAPTSGASADHKMYEDIEIMRHILNRKLLPLYPRTNYAQSIGGMMGMQSGMMTGMQGGMMGMQGGMMGMQGGMMGMLGMPNNTVWHQEICQTLEGVYWKGQGVIYTATLSSLQTSSKTETPRPPLSEWENVRRQLRNEKEAPKKPTEAKPAPLSDVLLKVLAENGRHFAQLGENESLTIVLTVHEKDQPAMARKAAETPAKVAEQALAAIGNDVVGSKVRDLELLGDLHLKQGKAEEAIRAFQQAVELKPVSKGLRSAAQAASLHRKLAQCYLMLEQSEKAKAEVERAISIHSWPLEAKDKPAPAVKPAAVALPVKLIISAPKKLLDQLAEGKIQFEEFRRRVSVETLTFDGHR